jgi:CHAP domain
MANEWWTKGYPGGPMVAVNGFPRPLYPPDAKAKGKTPSVDGPDVEAYKRVVSRAGRWVWQAFDQDFSNAFSHGKGANVVDTGLAGVQRQQKLDDTGWVGEKTFNTLRSIRIPQGLPHAGEAAMDARAVELINAAWKEFKGKEPAPPPTAQPGKSAAQERLSKAIKEIGTKESPPNSNQSPYSQWYGMIGPWCAMFCTWSDQTGGKPTKSFVKGSKYAYVPYIVSDARMGYNGLSVTSNPQPGDLVCFDWDWNGEYDHIGLFEKWLNNSEFQAIEGNTSTSDNSNGGEVMRRTRNKNSQATVFVRVKE